MYMDQLASVFGGFVPFRSPAPPGHVPGQSKWQRMTLKGAEMPDGSSIFPEMDSSSVFARVESAIDGQADAGELQMAREVIQAARLWANIKKIRHQKIK